MPGPLEPADAPEPDSDPLWPAWYGFVALLVGLIGTVMAIGTGAAIFGLDDTESAEFVIVGTVVQGAVFAGTAIGFAGLVKPPRRPSRERRSRRRRCSRPRSASRASDRIVRSTWATRSRATSRVPAPRESARS